MEESGSSGPARRTGLSDRCCVRAAYGRALGTGRQPAARAAAEGRCDGARAVALIPYSPTRHWLRLMNVNHIASWNEYEKKHKDSPVEIDHTFCMVRTSPIRNAFLVGFENVSQMSRAIEAASTIWGGSRSPIVALDKEGKVPGLWMQICEVMGVERIIDFTVVDAESGESEWVDRGQSPWPVVDEKPLNDGNFWSPHPLLVNTDLVIINQKPKIVLPGNHRIDILAGMGNVALSEEVKMWRDKNVTVSENSDNVQSAIAQITRDTVLYLSERFDREYAFSGCSAESMALIWVVDPSVEGGFWDSLWFWNLRLLRPRSSNAPSLIATKEVLLNEAVRKVLDSQIRSEVATTPDAAFCSMSTQPDELRSIASDLGYEVDTSKKTTSQLFASVKDLHRKISVAINLQVASNWIGDRSFGSPNESSLIIRNGKGALRAKSPVSWRREFCWNSKASLSISAPEIKGPRVSEVAKLYHQSAEWFGGGIRLHATPSDDFRLELRIPSPAEVLSAAFAQRSCNYELNDKGQQINGVIGRQAAVGIFRHAVTIEILTELTPKPSKYFVKALEEELQGLDLDPIFKDRILQEMSINNDSARDLHDIASRICSRISHIDKESVGVVLRTLVERDFISRAWRIDCPVCSLKSFCKIQETTSVASCPGCGSRADYAATDHYEPRVYYQLSSLLKRLKLNGGLAPLAATVLLQEEGAFVIPGANVYQNGVGYGDLDIVGWVGSSMFAGEAKMTASGFLEQDIESDIEKSIRVGADTHLLVCMEAIDERTLQKAKEICNEQGIKLRVLDKDTLVTSSSVLEGW